MTRCGCCGTLAQTVNNFRTEAAGEVFELGADYKNHDLAVESAEMFRGVYIPRSPSVRMTIEASYAVWGTAGVHLFAYAGQPDVAGTRLYDVAAAVVPGHGTTVEHMNAVSGESASGVSTVASRVIGGLVPNKPLTWQILASIIGGLELPLVGDGPNKVAITPNGTKAFTANTDAGAGGSVSPVLLGRPLFSVQNTDPQDVPQTKISSVGSTPIDVDANNTHYVVSCLFGNVRIGSVATNALLASMPVTGTNPFSIALEPNGANGVVGTANGRVSRFSVPGGVEGNTIVPGGAADDITGVDVNATGTFAYAVNTNNGNVYKLNLPAMTVAATIAVGDTPFRVKVAPDAEGAIWVLCRPASPANGRLKKFDPATQALLADYPLPFTLPNDFALVPTAGQALSQGNVVRTAVVGYDTSRWGQFTVGGVFAGQAVTPHQGTVAGAAGPIAGIAINDFGEFWLAQTAEDRLVKFPGARVMCRAAGDGLPPEFYGEYLRVRFTPVAG